MRRKTALRNENQVSVLGAEIDRLKALMSKITDGHELVQIVSSFGGTTIPAEPSKHIVYGDKHTKNLRVSQVGSSGNTVEWEGGQVWSNDVFYEVSSGSDTVNNGTFLVGVKSFDGDMHVTSAATRGVGYVPCAEVVVIAGQITEINDKRAYLSQESHDLFGSEHFDMQGTPVSGDIIYNLAGIWARLPKGSVGEVLKMGGSFPEWGTSGGGAAHKIEEHDEATNITHNQGALIYASTTNLWDQINAGTAGYVLTMTAGFPGWSPPGGGGTHDLDNHADMGSVNPSKGDLLYAESSSEWNDLSIGALDGYILETSTSDLPAWTDTIRPFWYGGQFVTEQITSGNINASGTFIQLTPFSGSSDNLDKISGLSNFPRLIILKTRDEGDTITVRDSHNNSTSGRNIRLTRNGWTDVELDHTNNHGGALHGNHNSHNHAPSTGLYMNMVMDKPWHTLTLLAVDAQYFVEIARGYGEN